MLIDKLFIAEDFFILIFISLLIAPLKREREKTEDEAKMK